MIVTFLSAGDTVPCDGCALGLPAILRREGCGHAYCDACREARAVEPCRACTVADEIRAAERFAMRKTRRIDPLPAGRGSHGEVRKAPLSTEIRCLACGYRRPKFNGWAFIATRCDGDPATWVHMWEAVR